MQAAKLKEVYEVVGKFGSFYSGGNVEWFGDFFLCQNDGSVMRLDVDSGTSSEIVKKDGEDGDAVTTFTSDGTVVISAHRSGLLQLWSVQGEHMKSWKSIHKGPIARLCLKGQVLASGGCDGVVRLWDLASHACFAALRGSSGVVSVVEFSPDGELVVGCGDDCKVHCWKPQSGQLHATLEGHFSKVSAVAFAGDLLVSASRDKVLLVWNLAAGTLVLTIVTFECVETMCSTSLAGQVATAGERGLIRLWDVVSGRETRTQTASLTPPARQEGDLAVVRLRYHAASDRFAAVSVDHNIIVYEADTLACTSQLAGFLDEVHDLVLVGEQDEFIAVATNSPDVKLYAMQTMACRLLTGHADMVLALARCRAQPRLFASASKCSEVWLWRLDDQAGTAVSVAKSTGHAGPVGALAFSNCSSSSFLISAGQDGCVKMWSTKEDTLTCLSTEREHSKDINCVAVSPNDKLMASGSQDRTVRLWGVQEETVRSLGVLRGHRRGVWCCAFSPVDQVLATGSADCAVKLWSVADFACLKTFEGHAASVLRLEFLSHGQQIITGGADGLLKLYSVKTSECSRTFDEHHGRIWALAVSSDEKLLVTGAADSQLIKWSDRTAETRLEEAQKRDKIVLEEQKLSNLMQNGTRMGEALRLALGLQKPRHALRAIKALQHSGDGLGLASVVGELEDTEKEELLKYTIQWNTSSRTAHPAQAVLQLLLQEATTGRWKPSNTRSAVEALLAYTDRHFRRLSQLLQDQHLISFTLDSMRLRAPSQI